MTARACFRRSPRVQSNLLHFPRQRTLFVTAYVRWRGRLAEPSRAGIALSAEKRKKHPRPKLECCVESIRYEKTWTRPKLECPLESTKLPKMVRKRWIRNVIESKGFEDVDRPEAVPKDALDCRAGACPGLTQPPTAPGLNDERNAAARPGQRPTQASALHRARDCMVGPTCARPTGHPRGAPLRPAEGRPYDLCRQRLEKVRQECRETENGALHTKAGMCFRIYRLRICRSMGSRRTRKPECGAERVR